uniref:Inner centromere protein ARK-binding domain-containing protein n=1 Tax=Chromera velia CCMP2878 TaxID=1169474 RepID=A0A0G4H7K1_9ALVE|eukprot:Cvel_25046.t1-p1 / transcript=Cvel_25046.t1 / gene=Cvel_25046 / organism=Chromera_velia_CCMP2878 / gene_product=hypothetical protein / transcript_product=hypothetical protein / location=Cvel_scaffold2785:1367-7872(-) / protein_length=804 / sequence_SO=supercontig / SO=protein_coding / is_pseudo=false
MDRRAISPKTRAAIAEGLRAYHKDDAQLQTQLRDQALSKMRDLYAKHKDDNVRPQMPVEPATFEEGMTFLMSKFKPQPHCLLKEIFGDHSLPKGAGKENSRPLTNANGQRDKDQTRGGGPLQPQKGGGAGGANEPLKGKRQRPISPHPTTEAKPQEADAAAKPKRARNAPAAVAATGAAAAAAAPKKERDQKLKAQEGKETGGQKPQGAQKKYADLQRLKRLQNLQVKQMEAKQRGGGADRAPKDPGPAAPAETATATAAGGRKVLKPNSKEKKSKGAAPPKREQKEKEKPKRPVLVMPKAKANVQIPTRLGIPTKGQQKTKLVREKTQPAGNAPAALPESNLPRLGGGAGKRKEVEKGKEGEKENGDTEKEQRVGGGRQAKAAAIERIKNNAESSRRGRAKEGKAAVEGKKQGAKQNPQGEKTRTSAHTGLPAAAAAAAPPQDAERGAASAPAVVVEVEILVTDPEDNHGDGDSKKVPNKAAQKGGKQQEPVAAAAAAAASATTGAAACAEREKKKAKPIPKRKKVRQRKQPMQNQNGEEKENVDLDGDASLPHPILQQPTGGWGDPEGLGEKLKPARRPSVIPESDSEGESSLPPVTLCPLICTEGKRLRPLPPPKPEDNYPLTDVEDMENRAMVESDGDEKKTVPAWAEKEAVKKTVFEQKKVDPDSIFGTMCPEPVINAIFSPTTWAKVNRTWGNPRPRRSSQNWNEDKLRLKDLQAYKAEMGYTESLSHLVWEDDDEGDEKEDDDEGYADAEGEAEAGPSGSKIVGGNGKEGKKTKTAKGQGEKAQKRGAIQREPMAER